MQLRFRAALLAALPAVLAATDTANADFAKWWPQFQAAVAQRDVKAVTRGVKFPLDWENGATRAIKSEADLAKSFDVYFTAETKKIIAAKKPVRMPNGIYSITWKARGNEYSLYFKPAGAGVFVLDGLSEGPP